MKLSILSASALLMASAMVACGSSDASSDKGGSDSQSAPTVPVATDADGNPLSGIRYYDLDTIKANYNLAKDYAEAAIRLQRNLESTMSARSNAIQKAGESFQTKLNGGQFASEAEAKTAYENVQRMQANAEAEIGKLQQNTAMQLANMEQEVIDSIQSVINDIGRANGLEAIIASGKKSGMYFAPELDITTIMIEELNKRYTKVAEK